MALAGALAYEGARTPLHLVPLLDRALCVGVVIKGRSLASSVRDKTTHPISRIAHLPY